MQPSNTAQLWRSIALYTLLCVILILASVDALLWHVDPLGIRAYFYGQIAQQGVVRPASHGYDIAHGTHDFINFSVTIGSDGNRIVPAAQERDCSIGVLGDSVTFGWGVDDEETYVNLLAQNYPDVAWRNLSRSGYSAANIVGLHDSYQADAYIWLIINNDHEGRWNGSFNRPTSLPSASQLYFEYALFPTQRDSVVDLDTYASSVNLLADDTLFFGFDEPPANSTTQAIILEKYTETVSVFDQHPNAQGHRDIAQGMIAHLDPYIQDTCHAE